MANRRMTIVALAVSLGVLAVAAPLASMWWRSEDGPSPAPRSSDGGKAPGQGQAGRRPADQVQLDCIFYRFTIERPTFEFLFTVEGEPGKPRFKQLLVATINGSQRSVDMKEAPYPEWRLDPAPEPKELTTTIDVYDNSAKGQHSESVTIQLYKYDPAARSGGWIEAGMKSIHYQNLPGQCRQAAVETPPAE